MSSSNSSISKKLNHDSNSDNGTSSNNNNNDKSSPTDNNNNNSNMKPGFSTKWRQLRACARCHRLKMRCSYDDPSYSSCSRCFAAGVECSVVNDPTSATAKKRKRSKSEKDHLTSLQTNLKELFETYLKEYSEKREENIPKKLKLENIEKIYDIKNQLTELQQFLSNVLEGPSSKLSSSSSSINSIKDGPVKLFPKYPSIPFQYNVMKELIKLKLVHQLDCQNRFTTFIEEMLVFWPNVSLPSNYLDFIYLLENRPLVLLACVSVTALNEPNLHDLFLYYLERNLAQRVCITGDISVDLIYVYTILSLWSSPPKKWGSFKHQMNLLMALNLSLCLESPNEKFRSSQSVLYTNSEQRKIIRCHVTVYACCGSLGLSLPKFKIVSWNKNIASCCEILLMGETTRLDRFLSYYARIIKLGQEISDYFTSDSKINQLQLGDRISSYEKRLQELIDESDLFTPSSKERYLLYIIYYQLLMTMHDYVVCDVVEGHSVIISEVYLASLSKLIRSAEKVVDSFVNLCDQTTNFPTFFYYRPMHALVALIRARLLVVLEKLDVDINVQREYDRVKGCLTFISGKSLVAKKMSMILTRVEKWMKISVSFNKEGATNSMEVLLGELGDEKGGVENLKPPNGGNQNINVNTNNHGNTINIGFNNNINITNNTNNNTNNNVDDQSEENTLQDFFKEIDQDLLNIQFMNNQNDQLLDDTSNEQSVHEFFNDNMFSDFMEAQDNGNLMFNFESTGDISRKNSAIE